MPMPQVEVVSFTFIHVNRNRIYITDSGGRARDRRIATATTSVPGMMAEQPPRMLNEPSAGPYRGRAFMMSEEVNWQSCVN
jgi:hypothetical protein